MAKPRAPVIAVFVPQRLLERLVHTTRVRRLKGLVSLLGPYKLRVAATFVALVVATAAALAPPYIAGRAIDAGIRAHDVTALYVLVAALVASAAINWAATWLQTYLVSWVGQRALAELRIQIFAHLQRMSLGFYTKNRTGVLISRMTNDVEALDQLVTDGVVTLFSSTLTLVGIAAIMLFLDPGLALVTFLCFPVLGVASLVFRIASANAYRLTREKIAVVTAYLQETLAGVRVVRAFSQEERHKRRFAQLNADNRQANMRTVYLNAAYFPAVELLSAVATCVLLAYGGHQVLAREVSIGVLASFVFYVQSFFDPIQQLSQLYTTYQAGMAALDKVFDLLDQKPDLITRPGAVDLPLLAGGIRFDRVSHSYAESEGPPALLDVDLAIEPGETVALVGATGAGKSTFAKLVARFYDPSAGRVLIDGYDLRAVTTRSLRRQLGIVPQEGFLFSGTIADNIAFARPRASRAAVISAASAVGADQVIERLPGGYDTQIGERGTALSAGERQLVAFARAAMADPRILICDEATSNVDVATEARIERGLRSLLENRTAIVIAHRLSTIRRAERIIVLERGRVVEQGTHAELAHAQGAYARLYGDWSGRLAA